LDRIAKRLERQESRAKALRMRAGALRQADTRAHVPARPFHRPAFDENKDRALKVMADVLRALLSRWASSGGSR
ncbi:MAG: hypothetical protein ACREJC_00070, partial [Tepidisphaeraceae bacterium]